MTEIVINSCWGGFGLSDQATEVFAKRKGIKLYKREDEFGRNEFYTVSLEEYDALKKEDDKKENWTASNEVYYYPKYERDDPDLIAVVKELGSDANGPFAELAIIEIPDDIKWQIEEYDGLEHVAEEHNVWYPE